MTKRIAVFHMLPSGGGIKVTGQFASGLAEHFKLDVYRAEGGMPLAKHLKLTEKIYPYPSWKKPNGILRPVAPIFLMIRLLAFKQVCKKIAVDINNSADLALVHNTMPIAAPPIFSYLTIPSLYFCYEYPRHLYEKSIIQRASTPLVNLALKPLEILEKRTDLNSVRNTNRIATFSTYMRSRIRNIYGKDSVPIPPGVDTAFFSPDPTITRENFVLSVGALWPFKGHETAIRILSLIPAVGRPILRITADREFPGYKRYLLDLADKLSVKVIISNGISNRELLRLYRTAKAVLCCQRKEPYGLVPLEAMACKTPVIAISEGGFTDNIIDGKTGFLFDGTAEAGAEALAKVTCSPALTELEEVTESAYKFIVSERDIKSGVRRLTCVLGNL